MTEPDLYSLTRRLERLERESRRWKAAASVLAIVAVIVATIGATASPSADIQARSLTILDRVGQTRIRLAMDDDHVTHLDMWGPGKQPVLALYAGPTGGTVHVEGVKPGLGTPHQDGQRRHLPRARDGSAGSAIAQHHPRRRTGESRPRPGRRPAHAERHVGDGAGGAGRYRPPPRSSRRDGDAHAAFHRALRRGRQAPLEGSVAG